MLLRDQLLKLPQDTNYPDRGGVEHLVTDVLLGNLDCAMVMDDYGCGASPACQDWPPPPARGHDGDWGGDRLNNGQGLVKDIGTRLLYNKNSTT